MSTHPALKLQVPAIERIGIIKELWTSCPTTWTSEGAFLQVMTPEPEMKPSVPLLSCESSKSSLPDLDAMEGLSDHSAATALRKPPMATTPLDRKRGPAPTRFDLLSQAPRCSPAPGAPRAAGPVPGSFTGGEDGRTDGLGGSARKIGGKISGVAGLVDRVRFFFFPKMWRTRWKEAQGSWFRMV